MSGTSSSLGLERRSSFTKPPTPKRFGCEHGCSVGHTRVEDESAIEKKYSFGEVLGQGAFGVVKEVTNKVTQEQLAMKIVLKDKPGSNAIQLLEREVEVLKRVNHPSIIQLEEVFETAQKMYLIMELCKGGELSEELKKRTYFKEEEAKVIMRRLTDAVVYMHDNDMVHRDLKLENVLLSTADETDPFIIKVTDFGLAHMKGVAGCDDLMHSKCGTLYYMAPEVLNNKDEYTKMCDVWSLGVIMYTLLCGRVPFQSDTPAKLEDLILKGELNFPEIEWINVSKAAKDLVRSMLCVDTTGRYTARSVLDDPWFTGNPSKRLNALDLMRTLDSESEDNENAVDPIPVIKTPSTCSIKNPLETVPEYGTGVQLNSKQIPPNHVKKVPSKALKTRTQSSSALLTGTSNHSKHHLSANSSSSSGRNCTSGNTHTGHLHSQSFGGNCCSSTRTRSLSVGAKNGASSSKRPSSASNKHSSPSKFKA